MVFVSLTYFPLLPNNVSDDFVSIALSSYEEGNQKTAEEMSDSLLNKSSFRGYNQN